MIAQYEILKSAFLIVPTERIFVRKYTGSSVSPFGVLTQSFSDWEGVKALVQPGIISSFGGKCVELKDYKDLGLDWSRRYITAWLPYKGLEPAADRDGADQIKVGDKIFTVLQVENWGEYTGYQRCYCVELKD